MALGGFLLIGPNQISRALRVRDFALAGFLCETEPVEIMLSLFERPEVLTPATALVRRRVFEISQIENVMHLLLLCWRFIQQRNSGLIVEFFPAPDSRWQSPAGDRSVCL